MSAAVLTWYADPGVPVRLLRMTVGSSFSPMNGSAGRGLVVEAMSTGMDIIDGDGEEYFFGLKSLPRVEEGVGVAEAVEEGVGEWSGWKLASAWHRKREVRVKATLTEHTF